MRENEEKFRSQLALAKLEGKGKKNPYTSNNGYMIIFLSQENGIGYRLPKERMEALIKSGRAIPMMQYGKNMKDFVHFLPENWPKDAEAVLLMKEAFEYSKNLTPK
jgi:hypothetical protein